MVNQVLGCPVNEEKMTQAGKPPFIENDQSAPDKEHQRAPILCHKNRKKLQLTSESNRIEESEANKNNMSCCDFFWSGNLYPSL